MSTPSKNPPLLYYSQLPPSQLTEPEQQQIINWFIEQGDCTYSDACGLLEASFTAAFRPHQNFVPGLEDTRFVIVNTTVWVFIQRGQGQLEFLQKYTQN